MASYGKIGNYTVVGDEIHLNYLFNTNSGAGIRLQKGSNIIKINEDNTITDNAPLIESLDKVNLNKMSKTDKQEFLEYNNISNILNNYEMAN